MIRSIIIVLAFLILSSLYESYGQIRPGHTVGANFSTMAFKGREENYNPETSMGIHVGAIVDIPLRKNLSFQPAFLFSSKGSDFVSDTADFNLSPIYIEIPLNVISNFGFKGTNISLSAGAYVAYAIGGYRIEIEGDLTDLEYGTGESDDLRPFDAGLNFGAGITIKSLMIVLQYGIGLIDISAGEFKDSELKNRVISISVKSIIPVIKE